MKKSPIRVAIIGVGNCASALVQGVSFYNKQNHEGDIPGVMFKDIGGYQIKDIEFVVAFDVDARKVDKKLSEAIFSGPNCARVFEPSPTLSLDPYVLQGPRLDGVADHMLNFHSDINFNPLPDETAMSRRHIIDILRILEVDVLLNYLPVGSQKATEFYMECALEAKVNVVNCIPVFIASDPVWRKKFEDVGVSIIGDDMRSQVGASVLSQVLQELAFDRGAKVKFHQQLNVGGNTDFGNMTDAERIKSKKISKENVIKSQNTIRGIPVEKDSIYAGPSSFVPYLKDNKLAYINMKLEGFGGAPIDIDVKLSVQDSENSAGVVIDAIRYVKVANEMGIFGALFGPSAWTQKTPPTQLPYAIAKEECARFARREMPLCVANDLESVKY